MTRSPDEQDAPPRILVIVPAFNEAGSVGGVVRELSGRLPECDVVVVNDGSTDATVERVASPARVISLPFNLGIGGAMQTGYRYARDRGYDVAVQVDADGQHPPDQVRRLTEHLRTSGADLVIGSRFLEPGTYRQTFARRTGIRLLGALIRVLCGRRITDCTSGFRAVNRRTIHAFAHWYPDDYPEPQVVPLLHRAGCKVIEFPILMNERTTGRSSIGLLGGVFYVVKVTTSLLLDTMRSPWPQDKVDPT